VKGINLPVKPKKSLELKNFMLSETSTIWEAMELINNNFKGFTMVIDKNNRVIGTITDGDIRRGLLKGLTFQSGVTEIMIKTFTSVLPDTDRASVLDIMMARSIQQIPVIDSDRKLKGIHFIRELIGASVKPNIAFIMAGGKGVRLMPLTEQCPKPMIPVAGRPILERVILHLVGYGIRNIYVSINYLGKMIEDYFGDGSACGCSITYLKEGKALGTGGALSLLPETPEHPIIVMNGDLVTQINIAKLLEFHTAENVKATIAVKPYQMEIPFGVINSDENRLVQIQEKPSLTFTINTGIYILNPEVLPLVPKNEEFLITSLFDLLIEKRMPVGIHLIEEDWIDIGRHEELKRAKGII
jgi:dTDP-glucose pyrophosphorylase/predicted transcriptional regulator